jgi:hypothetical protein
MINDITVGGWNSFEAYTRAVLTQEHPLTLNATMLPKTNDSIPLNLTLVGCREIRIAEDPVQAAEQNDSKILFHSSNPSFPLIYFLYKDEEDLFILFKQQFIIIMMLKQIKSVSSKRTCLISKLYYIVPNSR